jgi:hypothetical protein
VPRDGAVPLEKKSARRPPGKRDTTASAEVKQVRQELRELAALLDAQVVEIQRNRRDHELVFARMAQLQAELDDLKRAWASLSVVPVAQRSNRGESSD